MNFDFAYRCEDYVVITDANLVEFMEVLEQVKNSIECWDVNDVANALQENDFTSNAMLIALHF